MVNKCKNIFDCIEMKTYIQTETLTETENMTNEELLRYFNKTLKEINNEKTKNIS
jgi:hypothetical protein